jgi:hypothetical protein
MIESSEKTTSTTIICPITAPKAAATRAERRE